MFAARDQENQVYGFQTAAAGKPLNRGLAPKTPGKNGLRSPVKFQLNDENAKIGLGKGILRKGESVQKENAARGGKTADNKNAFVTPGPATRTQRAPLGAKTTNAKTRPMQTPGPALGPGQGTKPQLNSVSARKQRLKSSQGKVESLQEQEVEAFEERDIEYCPPKPIDLPDIPDDVEPLSTELLAEMRRIATENPGYVASHMPDWQGLTPIDRARERQEREDAMQRRKADAQLQCDSECLTLPCTHSPECGEFDDDCIDNVENRKVAEKKLKETLRAIDDEWKNPAWKKALEARGGLLASSRSKASPTAMSVSRSKPQPSTSVTATARTKLSPMSARAQKPLKDNTLTAHSTAKSHLQKALAARPKVTTSNNVPPSINNNRHQAAIANSRTTIGYAKGRSTSNAIHKSPIFSNEIGRTNAGSNTVSSLHTTKASTTRTPFTTNSRPGLISNSKHPSKPTPTTTSTSRDADAPTTPYHEFFTITPRSWIAKHGEPRLGSNLWPRLWRAGYRGPGLEEGEAAWEDDLERCLASSRNVDGNGDGRVEANIRDDDDDDEEEDDGEEEEWRLVLQD